MVLNARFVERVATNRALVKVVGEEHNKNSIRFGVSRIRCNRSKANAISGQKYTTIARSFDCLTIYTYRVGTNIPRPHGDRIPFFNFKPRRPLGVGFHGWFRRNLCYLYIWKHNKHARAHAHIYKHNYKYKHRNQNGNVSAIERAREREITPQQEADHAPCTYVIRYFFCSGFYHCDVAVFGFFFGSRHDDEDDGCTFDCRCILYTSTY